MTPGTADLTTRTDHACRHTTPPCALPSLMWTVHVAVIELPSTGTGQTVVVTAPDNQRDLTLRVGDTLVVSLASNYLPPTVTPAGVVVAREVTGGYPTDQPLVARYLATAPGQVDVATITDNACRHAPTPCPSPRCAGSSTSPSPPEPPPDDARDPADAPPPATRPTPGGRPGAHPVLTTPGVRPAARATR